MTNPLFIVIGIIALLIIGGSITGYSIFGTNYEKDPLPKEISKLPEFNLNDVNTYEEYKQFVDNTNNLILILNEQGKFSIPFLKNTQEEWNKVSNKITKYGPLINNYQEVCKDAKEYEKNKNEINYKKFYLSLGKFSLETSVISITLFYSVSYQTVGFVYKASGLSNIALKCPSCVSTVLSGAYWTIKTILVEESSKIATSIIKQIESDEYAQK